MQEEADAGQSTTPIFKLEIPEDVVHHFKERAKKPCKEAKEFYDKYLVAEDGYRYRIMKPLFYTYMKYNYSIDRSKKQQLKLLDPYNQAIALIVIKHLNEIEFGDVKFIYIQDILDVKIVEGWMNILDIVGADYRLFRTGQLKKFGNKLTDIYFILNDEIHAGKYPDTGLKIPTPEEYHKFMGNNQLLTEPPDGYCTSCRI